MAFAGWASQNYNYPLKNTEDYEEHLPTKPSSSASSMSSPKSATAQRTPKPKDPAEQAKLRARQEVLKRKFSSMKPPKSDSYK